MAVSTITWKNCARNTTWCISVHENCIYLLFTSISRRGDLCSAAKVSGAPAHEISTSLLRHSVPRVTFNLRAPLAWIIALYWPCCGVQLHTASSSSILGYAAVWLHTVCYSRQLGSRRVIYWRPKPGHITGLCNIPFGINILVIYRLSYLLSCPRHHCDGWSLSPTPYWLSNPAV